MVLGREDLRALVAHEIGHEYFEIEYACASIGHEHRRLRDLELLCDAVAIVTLHQVRMNPASLVAAVEKIARYNQKRFAARIDDSNYPTIAERQAFAHQIAVWLHGQ